MEVNFEVFSIHTATKAVKALIAAGAVTIAQEFAKEIYNSGMQQACNNFYGSHDIIDNFCEDNDYI